jgi:hypothetical protein
MVVHHGLIDLLWSAAVESRRSVDGHATASEGTGKREPPARRVAVAIADGRRSAGSVMSRSLTRPGHFKATTGGEGVGGRAAGERCGGLGVVAQKAVAMSGELELGPRPGRGAARRRRRTSATTTTRACCARGTVP